MNDMLNERLAATMFPVLPTGANEPILRDLANRMTAGLKAAKRGKANYWKSEDAKLERVYVTNQSGKKAGYVEMVDGKAFYREVAADELIAIFRAARKEQKELGHNEG